MEFILCSGVSFGKTVSSSRLLARVEAGVEGFNFSSLNFTLPRETKIHECVPKSLLKDMEFVDSLGNVLRAFIVEKTVQEGDFGAIGMGISLNNSLPFVIKETGDCEEEVRNNLEEGYLEVLKRISKSQGRDGKFLIRTLSLSSELQGGRRACSGVIALVRADAAPFKEKLKGRKPLASASF